MRLLELNIPYGNGGHSYPMLVASDNILAVTPMDPREMEVGATIHLREAIHTPFEDRTIRGCIEAVESVREVDLLIRGFSVGAKDDSDWPSYDL